MGKDFLSNGMSADEMIYYYHCCNVAESTSINNNTMAFGRVMTDKDGQKSINKAVDGMQASLTKYLMRK